MESKGVLCLEEVLKSRTDTCSEERFSGEVEEGAGGLLRALPDSTAARGEGGVRKGGMGDDDGLAPVMYPEDAPLQSDVLGGGRIDAGLL